MVKLICSSITLVKVIQCLQSDQILRPRPSSPVLFDPYFTRGRSVTCGSRSRAHFTIFTPVSPHSINESECTQKSRLWLHTVLMSNQWAVTGAASPSGLWAAARAGVSRRETEAQTPLLLYQRPLGSRS